MFSRLGRMVGKALQPLNHVLKRGSQREVVALAQELLCTACGSPIRVFKVRVLGKYVLVCDCGDGGVVLCDKCARELEKVWPPSEETKPPEERR